MYLLLFVQSGLYDITHDKDAGTGCVSVTKMFEIPEDITAQELYKWSRDGKQAKGKFKLIRA